MKTLLLLRHAKSDWDDRSLPDFDRPLADRGERDAPRMGKALAKHGPAPDLIVSSTAVRARQTTEAFLNASQFDLTPQYEDSIYGAEPAVLMKLIRKLPDSKGCVLLVGHNPGFEETVGRMTGRHERMPTAALACITFQIDHWEDVQDEQGTLLWLLTPKDV